MMNWCNVSWNDTANMLKTDIDYGLTDEKVELSRALKGDNIINIHKDTNVFITTVKKFMNLNIFLILFAAISLWYNKDFFSSLSLIGVIVIKYFSIYINLNKNKNNLKNIKIMNEITVNVKRNGKLIDLPCSELVVGDIVLIEEGMSIPADLRLAKSDNLKVRETAVTGKNFIVEKYEAKIDEIELTLSEMKNILYKGSSVIQGSGIGIVVNTGMNTEIGYTLKMSTNEKDGKNDLNYRLNKVSNTYGIFVVVAALLIGVFQYFYNYSIENIMHCMSFVCISAVAMESIMIIIQFIPLIFGMSNKKKYNVKSIMALERISQISLICMDKLINFSREEMHVKSVYTCDITLSKDDIFNKMDNINNCIDRLTFIGISCNEGKDNLFDSALNKYFSDCKVDVNLMKNKYKRIFFIQEDGENKIKTSLNKLEDGYRASVMGAVDVLMEKCTHIMKNNIEREITDSDISEIKLIDAKMSEQCLSVIGFAYRNFNYEPSIKENVESHLVFVGLIGFENPIKEDVKNALTQCKSMGIKTLIITDDNKLTAHAIGKKLGIINNINQILAGIEIDNMLDEEIKRNINKVNIFSRITPSQKTLLIEHLRKTGYIIALSGNKLTDCPSLKIANVGITSQNCTSETVKNLSHILIEDISFGSTIKIIEKSRKIMSIIKDALIYTYLLGISQLISIFFILIMDKRELLIPINIIFMNTVCLLLSLLLLIPKYKKNNYLIKIDKINENIFSENFKPIIFYSLFTSSIVYFLAKNLFVVKYLDIYLYVLIIIISITIVYYKKFSIDSINKIV